MRSDCMGRRDDKKAAKRWEANNPMGVRCVGRPEVENLLFLSR